MFGTLHGDASMVAAVFKTLPRPITYIVCGVALLLFASVAGWLAKVVS